MLSIKMADSLSQISSTVVCFFSSSVQRQFGRCHSRVVSLPDNGGHWKMLKKNGKTYSLL
jgi:hypothetical protein